MATYHFKINSGKKASAVEHAKYISREGKYRDYDDLVAAGHGNLPGWAENDPIVFWRAASKYERANGSVFREYEIAFPNELSLEQHKELATKFVKQVVGTKAYQYAIHKPEAKLGGVSNPHMHLMFSDRLPDGIDRDPDRTFARYNPTSPERGGCRKDSGGKNRMELRDDARARRKRIAEILNEMLVQAEARVRVDHRSYKDRGLNVTPERHLGQARIKRMSAEDKAEYVGRRQASASRSESPVAKIECDSAPIGALSHPVQASA